MDVHSNNDGFVHDLTQNNSEVQQYFPFREHSQGKHTSDETMQVEPVTFSHSTFPEGDGYRANSSNSGIPPIDASEKYQRRSHSRRYLQ